MGISLRKIVVLLAIVLSLTAVNAVLARDCNVTISGVITEIDDVGNTIAVEGTMVYGIPMDYLANKWDIVLYVGDDVVITAHQCPLTGNLSACTLQVNEGDVIYLPGRRAR